MGIFAVAVWWALSLLHHRLVSPLAWYHSGATICALTAVVWAFAFLDHWLAAIPVGMTVALIAGGDRCIGVLQSRYSHLSRREGAYSLIPPLIDAALAAPFVVIACLF